MTKGLYEDLDVLTAAVDINRSDFHLECKCIKINFNFCITVYRIFHASRISLDHTIAFYAKPELGTSTNAKQAFVKSRNGD